MGADLSKSYCEWKKSLVYQVNNRLDKTIDYTFKVVPFGFCSVQAMPLFIISFWLLRKSDKCIQVDIFWRIQIPKHSGLTEIQIRLFRLIFAIKNTNANIIIL